MRSALAYSPRPGPLQSASPGAAVAYLGAPVVVAFLYSSPLVLIAALASVIVAGRLAGAWVAVRAGLRMGLVLAFLIAAVNALLVNRGETVLARLGEWPLFGQVDITTQALADGAVMGTRALVTIVAFAVYSACVDPDRVLRALRPLAGRSALTATLVSRLLPVAWADAARLRDAAKLRGPGAEKVGAAAMARRLLAGSFDRAVDVAATLELRGYGLDARERGRRRFAEGFWGLSRQKPFKQRPRFDRRFYSVAAVVLAAAIVAKALGADSYHAYPATEIGAGALTLALSVLLVLSGLAPLRRKPKRRPVRSKLEAARV